MPDHHEPRHSRRAFLEAAASAVCLAGCGTFVKEPADEVKSFTQAQRAKRVTGDSAVAIISCESYEDDPGKRLQDQVAGLGLPDLKGKTVLVKPNMIEYRPDKPVTADPRMIAAAAELIDSLGAKEIIVGEGPGHFRDTDFLLEATGIGKVCRRLGLRFVDLNLDDLERLDNSDGLTSLSQFFLPRTVLEADAVVSLPKLKTHHWVGMTAAMKNLFGTVPGRKYGWPKNILHWLSIDRSIIDLVHLVRPSFAVVDAIVAMEGDGPINGVAKNTSFLVMGKDLAAVDATCARAIGIEPSALKYMRMAEQVVGNTEAAHISICGTPLDAVKSEFLMPVTFRGRTKARDPRRLGD